MSNQLASKSHRRCNEATFSTHSSTDWALWRLSLVLREISEELEPHADKKEPPFQALAKDALIDNSSKEYSTFKT